MRGCLWGGRDQNHRKLGHQARVERNGATGTPEGVNIGNLEAGGAVGLSVILPEARERGKSPVPAGQISWLKTGRERKGTCLEERVWWRACFRFSPSLSPSYIISYPHASQARVLFGLLIFVLYTTISPLQDPFCHPERQWSPQE